MANKVSDSVAAPGKQSRNERIEEFLREHYAFRYNTVKSRAEFRILLVTMFSIRVIKMLHQIKGMQA